MFKPWGHLTSPCVTSLLGWDFFCLVSDIFILYVWAFYLHICMCVYYLSSWCPWARRGHSIPWNWSYNGCKTHMSSRTQTWSITTGASALKHRTIVLAPMLHALVIDELWMWWGSHKIWILYKHHSHSSLCKQAYDAHNDKTIKEFSNKNPHFKLFVVVSNCAFVCLFVAMWNVKTPSSDSNWQSNL